MTEGGEWRDASYRGRSESKSEDRCLLYITCQSALDSCRINDE